jgi:aryl-alcohol dehydrogenase-like predicted oxidoreductase
MERRELGKTGLTVSVLGFGGAEIGFRNVEAGTVGQLLNRALDAGLNVLDTAASYAGSEALIGQTVSHRRDDYYLFTKCGQGGDFGTPDWSPETIEKSIERSLQRLKTDHLDLVQLHTCREEVLRQGDVITALEKAREAGKTRFIGYSGDSKAALYAVTCGAFDTLQTSVNIADQECVSLTLPEAEKNGIGVIAKRPVANVAWLFDEESSKNAYHYTYLKRLQELAYPFLSGPDAFATALRFTLTAPAVSTMIVGTTKPDRWQQNAEVVGHGPLPPEEYEAIRARWNEIAGADWTGQG